MHRGEGKPPERMVFILPRALDPVQFVTNAHALPRRELRQLLRNPRDGRFFDQVGEYQEELRNRLGGLNERFFDLFLRALTFQPIRNIRDFVEQWLLEASPLQVETLQRVKDRLTDLRSTAVRVEEQPALLSDVVRQQEEVRRARSAHRVHAAHRASARICGAAPGSRA